MANYEIQLGIGLNNKELSNVKQILESIETKERKVVYNVDFEIKGIDKLTEVSNEIENVKKQLKSGSKNSIPIDTKSLETSINNINESIKKLQNAFGRIDKNKGTQSLLTTVNKIRKALDGVSNQFADLNKNLNNLSSKDFSLNFDFGLNKSSKDPQQAIKELNMLRKEVEEYEDYFRKQFQIKDGRDSISVLIGNYNRRNSLYSLQLQESMGKGNNYQKIASYKEYIKLIKESANIAKIPIEPVEFRLAESGEFIKVRNEASETEKQLKELFSGGINAENLHKSLKLISDDLNSIKLFLDSLSSNNSIGELTQGFKDLSTALNKIVDNFDVVENKISSSLTNDKDIINSSNKIEQESDSSTNTIVQNEKRKQQEIKQTKFISDSAQKSIDGISSKGINKYFEIDKSDSNNFKNEMDSLVKQWTGGKGNLVDLKIDTRTSYDKDSEQNIERLHQAQVTYNNELGETIKKTIAWRRIGDDFDKDGKASPVYGFAEVSSQYSKSIGKTTAQTNQFVKQQKTAVSNLTNQINQLNRVANDQNASRPIKDTSHLNILKNKYDEITVAIQRMENASSDTFVDEQNNVKKLISEYKSLVSEYKNAENVKKAKLVDDIKFDINIGNYADDVDKMHYNFDKLSSASTKLYEQVEKVDNAYQTMIVAANANTGDEIADKERLIQAEKKYAEALEYTNNLIQKQAREERIAASKQKLSQDKELLKLDTLNWLNENTRATKEYGDELKRLISLLDKVDDPVSFKMIAGDIKNVQKTAQLMGKTGLTVFDRLKSKAKEYMTYLSAAELFMYAEQALREMFNTVLEIDTAMTGLYRVTDLTSTQYDTLFNNMISSAKEYGATLNDIINATTDWVRAGFDADTALGLAEVTTMYQHISDLDYGTAAENLITAYNGFKDELNGAFSGDTVAAVEYIADIFNELDNTFAVTSAGLGEALTRSASALDLAGNSIQETAGMITGIVEVTQDPEKAGSALKVLSLRLRGMKGALEELGEEADENVENISKMQGQIFKMTKGKVNIFDASGDFKSTYEIMKGIHSVWDDLSSIDQANLLETIAGKNRANDVAALLSNWENVEAAVKSASEAEGSASKENAKYVDSLQGRIDKLTTAWQSFANTFMESDFLKSGTSALTAFVEILEKLIDTFGSFGTIGLGVGIYGVVKNFKTLKDLSGNVFTTLTTNAMDSIESFEKWSKASDGVASGGKKLASSMSAVIGAVGIAVAAFDLIYNAIKNYKEEISKTRQETIKASDDFLDASSSFEQVYIKYSGRTSLTSDEELELESAIQGTVDALGDKSSALQGVVNSSNDYLASLEAIKKAELDAAYTAAKNKRDNAELELKDAVKGWTGLDGSEVDIDLGTGNTSSFEKEAISIADEMGSEFISHINNQRDGEDNIKLTLSPNADVDEIIDYYYFLLEYQEKLSDADLINTGAYKKVSSTISEMSDYIEIYTDGVYEAAKAEYQLANGIPKTTSEYLKMREAVLRSDDIKNKSFDAKMSILNTLDSEYGQMFDLSSIEAQARKFVGIIKGYGNGIKDGTNEIGTVETFLNMRTAVNNDECTVGQYLSEFDKVSAMADGFSDKEKEEFNLAFGLDTDSIKNQFESLKTKLIDESYGIEMSDNNAKMFLNNLNARELFAFRDLFDSNNIDFKNALSDYNNVLNEAKESSVDFSKTVFGNIDTNARKTLEWTSENLSKYKDELMSWESKDASWDNVKKDFEGSISTVMGSWDTFEIDGKKVDIAFSPMLQTDNGTELLSSDTVGSYIEELIGKATEDGKWTNEELFKLDSDGLEIDGKKIKGILADIGDTAESTSMQMHFVGKNGALAMMEEELFAIVEAQAKINDALNFSADIEVDKTSLESFNTALTESASAMGLTSDSIDNLESRYYDLESYDAGKIFEKTANGIKVNREELAKLEKEQNDLKKSEVQKHLETLADEYNKTTAEIDKCTNASERAELLAKRDMYANQIEELSIYQAQLEGVTSAYQRWLDAQNTPEDYQGYEAIASGWENVQDEIDRKLLGNASKEYIDVLSGEDLVGADIDTYIDAWNRLDDAVTGAGYSIKDFFTLNEDGKVTGTGVHRFFDSIEQDFDGVIYKVNEDGERFYDFSKENIQKVVDEYGIGLDAIQLLLEAASSAGYTVDWGGILDSVDLDTSNYETLISFAEQIQDEYNKIENLDDVDFNFSATGVDEAEAEIEKAREAFSQFINEDGTVNIEAEGAEEMQFMLSALIMQKQQLSKPAIINVDTSQIDKAKSDVAEVIEATKNFQTAYENYEIAISTGVNVEEARKSLNEAITELQTSGGDKGVKIKADLKLPTNEELSAASAGLAKIPVGATLDGTAIGEIETKIQTECTPEIIAKVADIDESLIQEYSSTEKTANGEVVWDNNDEAVIEFINTPKEASGSVKWKNDSTNLTLSGWKATGTVTWTSGNNVQVKVVQLANGTANVDGSAFADGSSGRAFKNGNWGIKDSGTALVGELGTETLVRNGRYYTIGDSGAEFIKYKKGDIIFNHKQTEELFKNGRVTSGGGRGRAYVGGSYPSSGSAFASIDEPIFEATATKSDFASNKGNTVTVQADNVNISSKSTSTSSSKSSTSSKSSSDDSKESSEEFKETIDWIETAINRIERAIDELDTKANSVYRSWSERNNALSSQIGEVGKEIELQQKAYDRYIKEANAVGLDESYAEKVRNGTIDIETITDEGLNEKINEYKEWYEKALDCKDAILELKETESELYAQRFENVQSQYDGIIQGFEHTENMLNEYISQAEEQGHIVSKKYYQSLIGNEKDTISYLKKEQSALIEARDEAVDSGKVVKYSEEWYKMCAEIDGVTQSIEESNTALLEYDNAMRDIDWSVFDMIQERISDVVEEADFLIELMSNDKLFDDKGRLNSQGLATMALHGQNYNTNMYQADEYGAEIARLNKQIESDQYDQELINRRNELIELQRESILAAEDEKNAIRDLVEEGIELELDSLQELIDKHNEALDSQKDLYDYQKKVKEQTEEIASLQKQMSAYSGDDSEEAKAKIQELKVSLEEAKANLEETEYDKFISDTEALLDNLYIEYETILNTRLDNIDYLLEQVIESVNTVAGVDGIITSALGSDGALAIAIGDNAVSVKTTLETEAKNVGTTLSTAMSNIWTVGDGNIKSVLTSYGVNFDSKSATIITTLNGIKTSVNNVVSSLNKEAEKKVAENKTSTSAKKKPTGGTATSSTNNKTNNTTSNKTQSTSGNKANITDNTIMGIASAIWVYGSGSGWGNNPFRENKLNSKIGSANAKKVQQYINSYGSSGKLYDFWVKNGKNLDKYKYNAFKTGEKDIGLTQLAWTQENGKEFIVRPSDGAILTPIAKGDSVLNANASSNIWDMANSPAEFIKNNLNLGTANVPNSSNVNNNYTQQIGNVVFKMDNVKNYEEMLSTMQKDKNFERLILSMSIDRIAGKSALAKGKAIR